MKAMIIQPMSGKTDKEIIEVHKKVINVLEKSGYEVVDTLFTDEFYKDENLRNIGIVQIPVYFISKSLQMMSYCDAVYLCKGWRDVRGCIIEHEVAKAYGLKLIYE